MTPEGKFFTIIFACEERYSHDLINELVDGILTTIERIDEVLDLVNQNLPEEQMMIALKEIRKRDNIPYEDGYDYEDCDEDCDDDYYDEYEEY